MDEFEIAKRRKEGRNGLALYGMRKKKEGMKKKI